MMKESKKRKIKEKADMTGIIIIKRLNKKILRMIEIQEIRRKEVDQERWMITKEEIIMKKIINIKKRNIKKEDMIVAVANRIHLLLQDNLNDGFSKFQLLSID